MFEDYLADARFFIDNSPRESTVEEVFYRYRRAAIFATASAFEGYVNHIAENHETAESFDSLGLDFLNDKVTRINPKNSKQERVDHFNTIESKINLLIFISGADKSKIKGSLPWEQFSAFKRFRNDLVHPRIKANEFDVQLYETASKDGLSSTIYLINEISLSLYGRKIRRKIFELGEGL
ncbi:hypothetical protein [Fretibacter rubidus]|uniref:hypothetical protein n=1 Tax=Fretibacter rubidus TaxID=570162 RepID=UPI00352A9DD5